MTTLPMFPLGTVLFPSAYLPLHVFEPRYRSMTRDCLAGDREFGVVLIERGNEVGGGDLRTDIGTVARIIEAAELDDGRWVLATVGVRRLRVRAWLPDEPYPRADVEDWDDAPPTDGTDARYQGVLVSLRRVLAMRTELGERAADATIELVDDSALGSFQAAAVAPFGPVDHQRLLGTAGPDERLTLLAELLDDEERVLAQRLALG
jgi:uncharacterized protein